MVITQLSDVTLSLEVPSCAPAVCATDSAHGADRTVTATFNYDRADSQGVDRLAQENFEAGFYQDFDSIRRWSARVRWKPIDARDFRIFVSNDYKISKALVHAWGGRLGRMEFPAWRVMARRAAIAHELVHVLFPNANRFLAEGLAVCLQAAIGGNPAFPNFGKPLHELVREHLLEMIPGSSSADTESLEQLHISDLDKIATPNPLTLRVGREFYGEEPRGQACIYSIAGSFVQFLMETRGDEKFHAVYLQTPLMPLTLNAGASDRWLSVYDASFSDLEYEWKAMIANGDHSAFS